MKLSKVIISHKPVSHGGLYSIKNPTKDILDFSSNVSPIGPPKLVKSEIKKQLKTLEIYPDSNSINLRKNLQWYTKLPYSNIVVGNGATEILYNFCFAFLSKNTSVLIPIPTFSEYEAATKLNGCKVTYFKTMNLTNDIDKFLIKIPKNGCMFICNPNNPTGILISKENMKKIIQAAAKKSTLVFVDECFIELVPQSDESIIKLIRNYDNLFVLRSLTKSFGLAGIRIGYGVGNKKTISILNKIKIPWNVSGLAQHAASAALCHSFYLDKTRKLIKKESIFLKNKISKIKGFDCNESATNFILLKTRLQSTTIKKKLLAKKILIRDCSSFRGLGKNHIRIAIKTRKENEKLIRALKKL